MFSSFGVLGVLGVFRVLGVFVFKTPHTIKLKNLKYRYMSLREWKELAQSKTKVGKMKNQLYDQITAEEIKSKTSDAAITKSFRLNEIIEGLKGKPQKKER